MGVVWVGLPVLLAATMLGMGLVRSRCRAHLWNLVLNRVLVCVAMVTVAVLLDGRLCADRMTTPQ